MKGAPFTPPRRYDSELLDDPTVDEALVTRSISDIVRSNTIFRGTKAVLSELIPVFSTLPYQATLLDVGTGMGDIPRTAQRIAARYGVSLRTIGLDAGPLLVHNALPQLSHGVCGDALRLPFANRSIDVVMCSQVLHHFRDEAALTVLREMNRIARVAVLVSDLRRSWMAAAGFWLASFPLMFHPVTRHDGVVSVMRGFTASELADTIQSAVGIRPAIHQRLGFRLTTRWTPI
jgi:SAM-dependent methyltransferase